MADETPSTAALPRRRLALVPVGFLVGMVVGVLGAYVQAMRYVWDSPWGYVVIPWGALLVLLVLVLTVRGAAWLAMTRWSAWAAFIGWLILTVALSSESPGGSIVLSGGGRQMFYLVGGVIVAVATATIPVPLRRAEARAASSD
ncbi:MAG: hypothetical protein RL205_1193 [Actinomycetota bacterium]|jgi:hypothetical protein